MKSSLLAMAALAAAGLSAEAVREPQFVFREYGKFAKSNASRSTKRYPQMVTSTPSEIAEWNRNVQTRQVLRHETRHA